MKKYFLLFLILFSYLTSQAQAPVSPVQMNQATPYREPSRRNSLWFYNGPLNRYWLVPDSVTVKQWIGNAGQDSIAFTKKFKNIGTLHSAIIDFNLDTIKTVRMYNIGVDPTKGTLRKDTNQFLPLYLPANTTINAQGHILNLYNGNFRLSGTGTTSGYYTDFVNNFNGTDAFEIQNGGVAILKSTINGTLGIQLGNAGTRKTTLFGSIVDTGAFFGYPGNGAAMILAQTGVPTADNQTLYGLTIDLTHNTGNNIATIGSITPGSGYTNGTYTAIPLLKVSGSGPGVGATATIVVSGGAVTSVTIVAKGASFTVGEVLTADIPGGTGFSFPVATIGSYTGVVYQPLNIKRLRNDVAAGDSAMVVDVNGNVKKKVLGGSGGIAHASVGLHTSGDTVKMGDSTLAAPIHIYDPAFFTEFYMNPADGMVYFNTAKDNGFAGFGARTTDGSSRSQLQLNAGDSTITSSINANLFINYNGARDGIYINKNTMKVRDESGSVGLQNYADYPNIKLHNLALTPWGMVKAGLDSLHTAIRATDSTIYKTNGTLAGNRTILTNDHSLSIYGNDFLNEMIFAPNQSFDATIVSGNIWSDVGASAVAGTATIETYNNTSSGNGSNVTSMVDSANLKFYTSSFGTKTYTGINASVSGVKIIDHNANKGAFYDRSYYAAGHLDSLWLVNWKAMTDYVGVHSGGVTTVSGTTNRITSTGGTTPVIDISSTFEALLQKTANFVDSETPSGTVNSSNVTFTLANTPITGSVHMYRNGVRVTNFTMSGLTVTFAVAPLSGDTLISDYRK